MIILLVSNEICSGKLKVQLCNDVGQGSYKTDIYECTCLNIIAIACQIPQSDFPELELLLLNHLLSDGFFSSLLSSDVWCFICRYDTIY